MRDRIIYNVLKAHHRLTKEQLPIYYRDELNLVFYATTKEEKKKYGPKDIKGKYVLHTDETYKKYVDNVEEEK